MYRLDIKPLSINKAYRGRRFATQDLKDFKKDLSWMLPKISVPKGKLAVEYIFGLSSKGSDGDNLIKAFQDCIAEAYGFNDNQIYKWTVEKVDTKKKQEYIEFNIKPLSYPKLPKNFGKLKVGGKWVTRETLGSY